MPSAIRQPYRSIARLLIVSLALFVNPTVVLGYASLVEDVAAHLSSCDEPPSHADQNTVTAAPDTAPDAESDHHACERCSAMTTCASCASTCCLHCVSAIKANLDDLGAKSTNNAWPLSLAVSLPDSAASRLYQPPRA